LWEAGIERMEEATRTGSSDLKTLSALYSQLGNAYYYLEDFSKAIEYHRQDLTIARQMGDKLGEAKACGNIGSALKAMGQFDEAIACCRMQLDLARELGDRVLESRALYNLGNGYHSKGKQVSLSAAVEEAGASQDEVEEQVREALEQATRHYEANLKLVRERNDYAAMGRTVGNLGNTYYLLGNYKKAIKYHEERLSIAASLNDYGAKRRALSNLGNAYVFLGKYSHAEQCYLTAMAVAREINDTAFVAQSCYSLGNTCTLMKNYSKAIEYHSVHLQYAQQLEDRVGEERAYWSLGNAYTCLGEHRQARHYAERHLQLTTELGDIEGAAIAQKNLRDLDNALDLSDKYECSYTKGGGSVNSPAPSVSLRQKLKERVTFRLEFNFGGKSLQSPDNRSSRSDSTGSPDSSISLGHVSLHEVSPTIKEDDAAKTDGFFDMICKYQSQRLDEQRAVLPSCPPHPLRPSLPPVVPAKKSSEDDQLLEMLFKLQHSRLNEQRCEMPSAPHLVSGAKRRGSQQGQQQRSDDGDDESDDVSSSEEEEEDEEERRDQLGELQPSPVLYMYITHCTNQQSYVHANNRELQ
jgi:tetratricopeptide (TPR) repeat protein